MLEQQLANQMEESDDALSDDLMEAYGEVRNKKALKRIEHNMKKRNRAHGKIRELSDAVEKLEEKGVDSEKFQTRIKSQRRAERMSDLVKRKHAHLESDEDQMVDEADERQERADRNFENRKRSQSR